MDKKTKQLFDIDLQFCKESQTQGSKAWDKYLSDNAIMGGGPHEPYQIGKEVFMPGLESFFDLEDLKFDWEPKHAFISDDETLGVTTGTYKRSFRQNSKVVNRDGKYTTTWKKFNDEWKIVLDIGN